MHLLPGKAWISGPMKILLVTLGIAVTIRSPRLGDDPQERNEHDEEEHSLHFAC